MHNSAPSTSTSFHQNPSRAVRTAFAVFPGMYRITLRLFCSGDLADDLSDFVVPHSQLLYFGNLSCDSPLLIFIEILRHDDPSFTFPYTECGITFIDLNFREFLSDVHKDSEP